MKKVTKKYLIKFWSVAIVLGVIAFNFDNLALATLSGFSFGLGFAVLTLDSETLK